MSEIGELNLNWTTNAIVYIAKLANTGEKITAPKK